MKKNFSLLLVLALLLPAFAGCQGSAPAAKSTDPPTQTTAENKIPETTSSVQADATVGTTLPVEDVKKLTRDEAIAIALKDAGFAKDQVRDLEAELDKDAGVLHYDVDFEKDGHDYDYEIDAVSGKILKVEKDRD